MAEDSAKEKKKEFLRKNVKNYKYEVWWHAQINYADDAFLEEFGSLKKAIDEAKDLAGQGKGEIFYVLKVREVFRVGG